MWKRGLSPIPHLIVKSNNLHNMKKVYTKPSTEEIKIQAPQVLVGSDVIPEWGELFN